MQKMKLCPLRNHFNLMYGNKDFETGEIKDIDKIWKIRGAFQECMGNQCMAWDDKNKKCNYLRGTNSKPNKNYNRKELQNDY